MKRNLKKEESNGIYEYTPILKWAKCENCHDEFRLEKLYAMEVPSRSVPVPEGYTPKIAHLCKNCASSKQEALLKFRQILY